METTVHFEYIGYLLTSYESLLEIIYLFKYLENGSLRGILRIYFKAYLTSFENSNVIR